MRRLATEILYFGCSSGIGNRNSRIRRSSKAIVPMWRCSKRDSRIRMPGSSREWPKRMAVVEWRELLALFPDTPELADVVTEIRRRVE